MLNYNPITNPVPAAIITDNIRTCDLETLPVYHSYLHTSVTVQTLCYGEQTGEILAVVPSPLVGDSRMMAFVASLPGQPAWTDYVPLKDTPEYNRHECDGCGVRVAELLICPECGMCLADCCDCSTENADDLLDVDGYQPPRFMWMGKMFPESID